LQYHPAGTVDPGTDHYRELRCVALLPVPLLVFQGDVVLTGRTPHALPPSGSRHRRFGPQGGGVAQV
jgi:hypothetical protein